MSRRRFAALTCAVALVATAAPVLPSEETPRYVLRQLALPKGLGLLSTPVRPLEPPFALAANGAVAALAYHDARSYAASHVVVWRADGTRKVIGLPSNAVLTAVLQHYQPPFDRGYRAYRRATFARVVLATDGTPFATMMAGFSGAFGGTDKGVVRWTGTRWVSVNPYRDQRDFSVPTDFDVAVAELPALRVAMTADYWGSFVNFDAVQRQAHYQTPQAWVLDATATHVLGFGRITSLAGDYACGYIGETNGRPMPDNFNIGTQQPVALLWRNARSTRLGRGIAFGVTAHGAAVGDNRTSIDGTTQTVTRTGNSAAMEVRPGIPDGVPTLWNAGRTTALAKRAGTAFAIARDGTIVGTFADGAGFVVKNGTLRELDALIGRGLHGAHVAGAYALDARGRILVTTISNGVHGIAVLDPATSLARQREIGGGIPSSRHGLRSSAVRQQTVR